VLKVLFIAYYFPPIGGGGVQRSVKFVKYLPEFGVAPIVLTGGNAETERWAPQDEALLRDLPPEAKVHRIHGLPPVDPPRGWGRRLRDACNLPAPFGTAWHDALVREGSRRCAEEQPDLIYVTLSPFEGAAAAAELSQRFGIPWVADLRDPWALDEMQVYVSGWHRRAAQIRMRRVLRSAALVIMNTPEAAHRLVRAFPEYQSKRVTSLTNGFDAADFQSLVHRPAPAQFRLVHTGSLHTHQGHTLARRRKWFERLGRVEPGVDFITRSHTVLLEAMRRWRSRDPRMAHQVRLILAGSLTPQDRHVAESSAVRDQITIDRYRSHPETVQLQKDAEVLFLPMHNLPPGRRATIVPGKAYEYLATGRPILAAVPDGDARDFVARAGTGLICRPHDVEAMAGLLQEQFRRWQAGQEPPQPDWDYLQRFERRELTRQLAAQLRAVVTSPAFPPAARVDRQPDANTALS
jgi:glycosyltransferase involved in cell wall biosynthesis